MAPDIEPPEPQFLRHCTPYTPYGEWQCLLCEFCLGLHAVRNSVEVVEGQQLQELRSSVDLENSQDGSELDSIEEFTEDDIDQRRECTIHGIFD